MLLYKYIEWKAYRFPFIPWARIQQVKLREAMNLLFGHHYIFCWKWYCARALWRWLRLKLTKPIEKKNKLAHTEHSTSKAINVSYTSCSCSCSWKLNKMRHELAQISRWIACHNDWLWNSLDLFSTHPSWKQKLNSQNMEKLQYSKSLRRTESVRV